MIGCGNFARRQHLPNLAAIPEARIRMVCDTHAPTAETVARAFGATPSTDLAPILSNPTIEAVIVAVPDPFQAATALACIEAGKHVYVEKPAATCADDFTRLVAARNRAKVHIAVGFNKRFAPAYVAARAALAETTGPRMLSLRMADDAWRWGATYAPGALLRHDLCHLFDLAAWFAGSPVVSVSCAGPRPDADALLLTCADGTVAVVLGSGHATMDLPKERTEIFAGRATVTIDDFVEVRTFGLPGSPARQTFPGRAARPEDQPWVDRIGDRGIEGMLEVRRTLWEAWEQDRSVPPPVIPNFLRDQGWADAMRRFVTGIRQTTPLPHAGLEDALQAALISDAALASRRTASPIAIPLANGGQPRAHPTE